MIKVLIIANGTIALEKFRKEVILKMLEQGMEVFVSSPNDGFINELLETGVLFIATPVNRHGTNPFIDLKLLFRYFRLMQTVRPDIVLTFTIKPNIYGNIAAYWSKIPVITTITGLGESFLNKNLVALIARILYKISLRHTSCIILQNKSNMDTLINYKILVDQPRILLPGSGVNLTKYQFSPYPQNEVIAFLYVGRLQRSKGITHLIDSAKKLKEEYPNKCEIIFIGYCDDNIEDLLNEAIQEETIKYLGFQSDVIDFIRAADCIVLPSYQEGMSNALLEAAAIGRPLITTDIGGCREIVDDGVNGFLCQPKSSEKLYVCMKKFIMLSEAERSAMGVASRKKVEVQFDRAYVVKKTMEQINAIIKNK